MAKKTPEERRLSNIESARRSALKNPEKTSENKRRYAEKNPNKVTDAKKAWRQLHPEAYLLCLAKHRAKRFGIPFNLTIADIHIPEFCPIFPYIKLEDGHGRGYLRKDSIPSLDKIIPEKGYVQGNVWVISWKANRLKSNATLEELELLVKGLKEKIPQ